MQPPIIMLWRQSFIMTNGYGHSDRELLKITRKKLSHQPSQDYSHVTDSLEPPEQRSS